MLKNYIKIAIRNITKYKGYSLINIFGFAVGITCCLMIIMFLLDELSYDQFYPNANNIYRVAHYGVVNNRVDHTARTSPPLAKVFAEELPEVKAVTKCRNYGFPVFRYKDKVFSEERVFSVDPTFFDVFQLPFIRGNPSTALARPDAIILTRSMAKKYFGDEDPLNKIINSDNRQDYSVTAVIEDVPENSHFHFDFLRSLENHEDSRSPVWVFNDFYTYILLHEDSDPKQVEKKLAVIVNERIDPFLRSVLGISVEEFLDGGGDMRYYLQPLTDIHLNSHLDFELESNGDYLYVVIFSLIALGILLIACINFINLTTARSTVRSREVGIRKTVGSTQSQIIYQFLTETIIMTLLAVILSWLIFYTVIPIFNQISGKSLTLPLLAEWWIIPLFLVFSLFIGTIAGFYPAFYLASFRPVKILKGEKIQGVRQSTLRTSLVIFQFTISIILIIATLTVHRQLKYIQKTNMGFNKDHVVVIHKTDDLGRQLNSFMEELQKQHGIIKMSNSVDLLGNHIELGAVTPEGQTEEQAKLICYLIADPEFLNTYGILLKEGRFFEKDRIADKNNMILNETAVQAMGLKNPVGKLLVNSLFPENKYTIIGVVEDFHFQSFKQRIQPMVFLSMQEGQFGRYLSVKIRSENISQTLSSMEDTWQKFSNGQAFEFEFFDDHFERIYLAEKHVEKIFFLFSILAILIACLGLFGLSAYITERRTKEVGIRKILGSSIGSIVILLVGQFLKWVIVATMIACPIAWFVMEQWLENYAYRTNIAIWTFLLGSILALIIAMVTVSSQAIKTARANPVEALRYE